MAKKKPEMVVDIPALEIEVIGIKIVGRTPLCIHRFAEKARKEMADKHAQKPKAGRGKRDPEAEYEAAKHKTPEGKDAMPAGAFRLAAITACTSIKNMTKVMAKQTFFILENLVEIHSDPPFMRTDVVRLAGPGRSADLRYRPQYDNWHVHVTIEYNPSVISPAQIINQLNTAGFGVGVGEMRPEQSCGEVLGRFQCESTS